MNKQEFNFYEDAKAQKKIFIALAILFYAGTLIGICGMIGFSCFIPADSPAHNDPTSEQFFMLAFMLVFCLVLAIPGIIIIKAEKFKYYIAITEDELTFFSNKQYKYNTADLKAYEQTKKNFGFTEYRLRFANDNVVLISTRKAQKFTIALDHMQK